MRKELKLVFGMTREVIKQIGITVGCESSNTREKRKGLKTNFITPDAVDIRFNAHARKNQVTMRGPR